MTNYTTKSGDMWDSIAYNLLGSESFVDDLISSNLDYANVVVFDSGVVLSIPEVVTEEATGIDNTLPPWR